MTPKEQVRLAKHTSRMLRQNMGRPMVIPNKKKLANKYACRKG